MPVIAMTRELGSLGNEVAEGLAKELGLKLVRHELIERLAHKTRLPASAILRCIDGRATLFERLRADLDRLYLYAEEEILGLAAAGDVVIRGWGANHLLRSISHVLCVRVCAPLELRAARVMDVFGLDDIAQARDKVRDSDAACDATMQRRFGELWHQAARHDIVLNTEHVDAGRCIAQIKRALQFPEYQPTPESLARMRALSLAAQIRAALRQERTTANFNVSVEARRNDDPGHVTLRGTVLDESERRAAEIVALRCPGVHAVDNRLLSMWSRFLPQAEKR